MSQVNSDFWFQWHHVWWRILASHSSHHVGRCSSVLSCHRRSHHGCFGRPGAQESPISAFNPLAAQGYVLCREGFSSLVCQEIVKATQAFTMKVYQQCWKQWAGWCASEGVPNNAISAPRLADFEFIYWGLARLAIQLVFTILLFQLFWNLNIITRLPIIQSSLN